MAAFERDCTVVMLRARMVALGIWDVRMHAAGDLCRMPRWRARALQEQGDGWPVPPDFSYSLDEGNPMDIITLVTPPSAEPITLSEAKQYVRVDDGSEDALITSLIKAARETVEVATGRSLLPQGWRLNSQCAVQRLVVQLPRGPVSAVASVIAHSAAGDVTLAGSDYQLLAGDRLLLKRMPSHDTLEVNFTAGYASSTLVPAPLKQAVLMLVAHLFDVREFSLPQLPASVAGMIAPFRLIRV